MDVHKFVRKLNIQRYISSNPFNPSKTVTSNYVHSGLSNASTYNPPGHLPASLRVFKDLVLKDLDNLNIKKIRCKQQLEDGIKSLSENKNLVIRPADEGGGIVVLNKVDYLAEMHRIVSDSDTYTRLPLNPENRYKKSLVKLVNKGFRLNILNKKEKAFLVPKAPRVPIMYYLPKVNKDPVCPPGRPIVSGIDSVTSRVGKYIDFYLQPLVRNMPSFLKDTRQVINMLSVIEPPPGLWLVTADVTSLYTIIPHDLGLEAVTHFLERDSGLPSIQISYIMELIQFAASHNFFWHDGQFYRQDKGVAMGAKYAPSLANLFMAKWE